MGFVSVTLGVYTNSCVRCPKRCTVYECFKAERALSTLRINEARLADQSRLHDDGEIEQGYDAKWLGVIEVVGAFLSYGPLFDTL